MASSLESLFAQDNTREIGEFIRELVRAVSPAPAPYELFAPEHLIADLTAKGSQRVLHLTNWTGNKFEKNRVKEYYLAPVANVRLLLCTPDGKRLQNIRPLVPGTLRARKLKNAVEVLLPRVDAWQGVAYTVEE